MDDDDGKVIPFPRRAKDLTLTIIEDPRRGISIVVSGFASVDEAVNFIEDDTWN